MATIQVWECPRCHTQVPSGLFRCPECRAPRPAEPELRERLQPAQKPRPPARSPMRGWLIAAWIMAAIGGFAAAAGTAQLGYISLFDVLLGAVIWFAIVYAVGRAVTYWTYDRKRSKSR